MKVLLINGSPNEKGCTYTAFSAVADQLEKEKIQTEIFWIGKDSIHGCVGCGSCAKLGICVYDDVLNVLLEKVKEADGYVFGSPVYYASPNGAMISLLDRLFMCGGRYMKFKPAASIVSARRAGTTASYDVLNKYIGINNMIGVPSPYWNNVHGSKSEDVLQDKEGIYIMRSIGANMAWLLNILELGKKYGILPTEIERARTNFIR